MCQRRCRHAPAGVRDETARQPGQQHRGCHHHVNMGLEIALRESNIKLLRAPVGDKYVLDEMKNLEQCLAASSQATSFSPAKPLR